MCLSKKSNFRKAMKNVLNRPLMLVTWDTGSAYMNRPSLSWQTWRTSEKLHKWYGDRVERGKSRKPTEPATGEMIFPGPPFHPKVPQMGEGQFFPPLPPKMPTLFHSGNKRQLKLCSKSVSNYQNQLVEAEKLFKKSHIFAWFHCRWQTKWLTLNFEYHDVMSTVPILKALRQIRGW